MAEFQGDRVLAASLRVWARNLGPIGLFGLVVFSPLLLWLVLGLDDAHVVPFVALGLLLDGFFRGAVACAAVSRLRGGPFDLRQGVRAVRARLAVVTGTTVVVALSLGLAALPAFVSGSYSRPAGIALSLVPVWVACVFSVAIPAAALERVGVAHVLARSIDLTRGRRLGVFVVGLVVGVPAIAVEWLLGVALQGGTAARAQVAAGFVISTLAAVVTAALYRELRGD